MSKQFETKLEEWAVWWNERKQEHIPIDKKIVVTAKMIEGLFDLFAYIARDLRDCEGRARAKIQSNSDPFAIWLPHGHYADKKQPDPDDPDFPLP